MNVTHNIIYKFTVSARELKLIRRSLALEGPNGAALANSLNKQIEASSEDIKRHFATLVEIHQKEGEP